MVLISEKLYHDFFYRDTKIVFSSVLSILQNQNKIPILLCVPHIASKMNQSFGFRMCSRSFVQTETFIFLILFLNSFKHAYIHIMLHTVIAKIIICNSTIVNKTIITICSMYTYCLATSLATRTLEKAKNANICNFTPYAYVKIARTTHNCRQQIEQSNNLQGKNEVLVQKVITKFFIRKPINLYT